MLRRDGLLVREMIDAAVTAHQLVEGVTPEDLAQDRQRRDALLWNFTVLGEAAGQVSSDLKASWSEVPWNPPVRMRNRIVHGYWSVDLDLIHATATRQLSGLVEVLKQVLRSLGED